MSWQKEAFEALSGAQGRPKGISDYAEEHEPSNFLRHAGSLALTKTADGLVDPKLVLSWLLTSLAAPSFYIGLLVPIREAGALLPQLFSAPYIHAMSRRKWAWAGASLGQGVAAMAIVWAGLALDGTAAGMAVCLAVALLAISRSVASVSYKDILGKTVGKSRRGAATGLASSVSSVAVIIFALALMFLGEDARMPLVIGALVLASLCWISSAFLFATLIEEKDDQPKPENPLGQLAILRDEPMLRRFIYVRGLLTGTALAPPYFVLLASQSGSGAFSGLGAMVLASSAASFLSSYVWGRFADKSSRLVLVASGFAGAAAMGLVILLDILGLAGTFWAVPLALFVLMIAYHGVRQGRSTYLVDLAPEDKRTTYAAVANTVIGILLLITGGLGAVGSTMGPHVALGLFAALCIVGAVIGLRLKEVEGGFD